MSSGHIQWGKIIAGAGVVVGGIAVIAFCPETTEYVIKGVQSALTSVYDAIGSLGAWISERIVGGTDVAAIKTAEEATKNLATVQSLEPIAKNPLLKGLLVDGAAEKIQATMAAAKSAVEETSKVAAEGMKGIIGFITKNQALAIGTAAAAGGIAAATLGANSAKQPVMNESFAMREDMRRMQALMQARMAATGYQPAMAGQQRG